MPRQQPPLQERSARMHAQVPEPSQPRTNSPYEVVSRDKPLPPPPAEEAFPGIDHVPDSARRYIRQTQARLALEGSNEAVSDETLYDEWLRKEQDKAKQRALADHRLRDYLATEKRRRLNEYANRYRMECAAPSVRLAGVGVRPNTARIVNLVKREGSPKRQAGQQ